MRCLKSHKKGNVSLMFSSLFVYLYMYILSCAFWPDLSNYRLQILNNICRVTLKPVLLSNHRPNPRKKDDDEKNMWFSYIQRYAFNSFILSVRCVLTRPFNLQFLMLAQRFLSDSITTVFWVKIFKIWIHNLCHL